MLKIVILEDNRDRQIAMKDCLDDRFHQYETVFFDNAPAMCAYLQEYLVSTLVISLDHDLELITTPDGTALDPGTGRQVADLLASMPPVCPVILHTTNAAAGDGMEFVLRDARWKVHRVHPFGDLEWISSKWIRTLRDAVVREARPPKQAPAKSA